MRFRRLACSGALLLLSVIITAAQMAPQTAPAPQHRPTSTPYSGDLSIFETPGRDQKLHIDQVMNILGIAPGKAVADIGAGSGWFTVRAARRVTSTGKVYAVDINQQAIDYIRDRSRKEQLSNVVTILNKPSSPGLPPDSIDAVLFLKAYHEIADPVTFLRNLRGSLRPGARVGIIERDGNGEDHGVNKEVILRETDEAGYKMLEEHDDLVKGDKMDYFLVLGTK
jgi:ubiquinone/menaquinone biosynthesis C-methylase UbiE